MNKKELLQMYRDICEINKAELTTELSKAVSEGTFSFASDIDQDRFFAVFESLIDLRNAAGYDIILNRAK